MRRIHSGGRVVKDLRIIGVDLQARLAVGQIEFGIRQNRIGQREGHLREGQRQDREIDPRTTQRDEPDQQGEQARNDDRQPDARQDIVAQQFEHPDAGIAADAEEGRMAERQIAGQAEQDVETDGEDSEDHEPLHQVRIARVELRHGRVGRKRVQQERCQHRQQNDDDEQGEVLARQPQDAAADAFAGRFGGL